MNHQTLKRPKFPIKIIDYKPSTGYPNAKRDGLLFFICQGCGAKKMDIDLYTDTGLCGDCQFKQWRALRGQKK